MRNWIFDIARIYAENPQRLLAEAAAGGPLVPRSAIRIGILTDLGKTFSASGSGFAPNPSKALIQPNNQSDDGTLQGYGHSAEPYLDPSQPGYLPPDLHAAGRPQAFEFP